MAKKLEVNHLTISFRTNNGAVRAVRDVSFDLNEGETLAIVGESGSGKSVTTRAIMGILAANAMVDGGEIIYDGRDLLKIPEEEFHTLRGHKLSMVFQDPLSALNPIMRIGNQLTEAMILNNKERRADGKTSYDRMLKVLQETGVSSSELDAFRAKVKSAVKVITAENAAREALIEVVDDLEEIDEAILKKNVNAVHAAADRIKSAKNRITTDLVEQSALSSMQTTLSGIVDQAKAYKVADADKMTAAVENARKALLPYTEAKDSDPAEQFCTPSFLSALQQAIQASAAKAREARSAAAAVLRRESAPFEADSLDEKSCKAAAKRAADAVDAAIDPLELDKDNLSYVFRSSMNAGIERYFRSLKHNPKEEKRFAKDTKKYEQTRAKGKFAPSVVPKNLIDTAAVKEKLLSTLSGLAAHYEAGNADKDLDTAAKAQAMVSYLYHRALDAEFVLGKGMAKHRAIELMKEVGIPEPHKRYTQYPFEFSGGMRQRIVIAIALSANPDILICDEPTTALDVTIQAQILELINRLKRERKLSVIFITHDLGVVANMADRIAIMYAGKIVENGTADDVFYDPRHPYTWALLSSMPDLETKEKLEAIPGTPPDMILPPVGDAFAARNKYAMEIDFEQQPPMFRVSDTHTAATWLLHPDAPKVQPPAIVLERIERMRKLEEAEKGGAQA